MKQKTFRYLFLLLLVFALPLLMMPNNAGAWTYVNDGALPAGVVTPGGALVTQGITASCPPTLADGMSGGFPCATGTSTIFGGWSISSAVANGSDNDSDPNTAFKNSTQTCLGCHSKPLGTANNKTSYLLTGHKNAGRKVAGTPYTWNLGSSGNMANFTTKGNYWWTGATGETYTTDSATNGDTINWTNGTLVPGPGSAYYVIGATPIAYVGISGWMTEMPIPGLMFDSGKSDGTICGKCHVTGWADTSAYTTSNAPGYQSLFLSISQPDASTSLQLMSQWGDFNGYPSPKGWVLDGVQCTACHDQTPSSSTGGDAMDAVAWPSKGSPPNYENTTELCAGCHQPDSGPKSTTVNVAGATMSGAPSNYQPGLYMKVSGPDFSIDHGDVTPQFLNSPHGRFTGTMGTYQGGAKGQFGTTVYTTPSGVQTTILTEMLNAGAHTLEDPNQLWQPQAYSSLFKNSVSGSAMEGRNYGCAQVCHDPHITTVDAVNAQPMQIGCNGYTYTTTGSAIQNSGSHSAGAPTLVNKTAGAIQVPTVYNCHQSTNTPQTVGGYKLGQTVTGETLGIDLTQINHPVGVGTPLGTTSGNPSEANDACVICHMPRPALGNDGFKSETGVLHLFRINTAANYSTFPAYTDNSHGIQGNNNNGAPAQANTAYDGSSFPGANSVWVDLDLACGQCHGGGATQVYTTGSVNVAAAKSPAILGLPTSTLNVKSSAGMTAGDRIKVIGAGFSPSILSSLASGSTDLETIITAVTSPTTITLLTAPSTVVSNAEVITNPTTNGANYFPKSYLAAMAANMHNQTAQVSVATSPVSTVTTVGLNATLVDNSTSGANITVDWGDGNLSGNAAISTGVAGGTFTHTYPSAGKYTVIHTAATGAVSSIESIGPLSVPVSLAVSGIVYEPVAIGSSPLPVAATVILKQNGIVKKIATSTAVTGAYSLGNVPYGTYSITAYAAGYTFTPTTINITATTTTANVTASY